MVKIFKTRKDLEKRGPTLTRVVKFSNPWSRVSGTDKICSWSGNHLVRTKQEATAPRSVLLKYWKVRKFTTILYFSSIKTFLTSFNHPSGQLYVSWATARPTVRTSNEKIMSEKKNWPLEYRNKQAGNNWSESKGDQKITVELAKLSSGTTIIMK